MTAVAPFMVEPPDGQSRPWRVVVGREQTGGAMSLGERRIPAGAPGPGRHVHTNEDEAVYVVSGVLTMEVGSERFEAHPRSFVWMPRGVPHVFANLGEDEVWTLGFVNPPGLEDMFREQIAYFESLQGPPDHAALMELSARYGVFPVEGPPLSSTQPA